MASADRGIDDATTSAIEIRAQNEPNRGNKKSLPMTPESERTAVPRTTRAEKYAECWRAVKSRAPLRDAVIRQLSAVRTPILGALFVISDVDKGTAMTAVLYRS